MVKHKQNIPFIVGAIVVVLGVAAVVPYIHIGQSGPTQAEWNKALGAPTNKTLFGKVLSRSANSFTLFAQETKLGTTTVSITASTTIVRETPLSPEDMKAAYEEYKKLETEANGKPFQGPDTLKIEPLAFTDITGDILVLVTLTPDSTEDHFVAEHIEVVPSNTVLPAAPSSGGALPAMPTQ